MARWRADSDGLRWLEGWASREAVCARAASLGHQMDVWYSLVDVGPYRRELGRCKHCDMTAGWGLLYQGKIAESIQDAPGEVNAWRRLYRGRHRKPVGVMYGPALEQRCRAP